MIESCIDIPMLHEVMLHVCFVFLSLCFQYSRTRAIGVVGLGFDFELGSGLGQKFANYACAISKFNDMLYYDGPHSFPLAVCSKSSTLHVDVSKPPVKGMYHSKQHLWWR